MKKKLIVLVSITCILTTLGCTKKNRSTMRSNTTTKVTRSGRQSTKTNPKTVVPIENKTIYVSADGNSSSEGLKIDEPTTLTNALKSMNSGDTIHLIKGTYSFSESLEISNSGSEVKRNILEGDNGVIFDFSDTKNDDIYNNGGILLSGSYWQINNITIINSDYYGFRITGRGSKINFCNANDNDYGGFYIKASLTTITNCMASRNSLPDYYAYGFYIDGAGENNTFDSCIAIDNSDSGFMIVSTKPVTFDKCLAINNGLEGDTSSSQRSGFVFNNKGHTFTNCIAYNNSLSGFLTPISYAEKGSYTITNCEAINNHYRNYFLKTNNADTINFIDNLSFNNYDGDNDGTIDAINDYIIGNVKNSIVFYDKTYCYEKDNPTFNSLDPSIEEFDFSSYEKEYTINLVIPEEMKEYIDLDAKAEIDAQAAIDGVEPDYSSLEYNVIYYKDGVLNIYNYLDNAKEFQDELFTKLELTNKYFGSDVNPKEDNN